MSFANPIFFILVIFIAFVVLLYFFRKQYEAVINPSNLLWQEVMNEWKATPWLQKLQQNILFWLQIAALILLMFALAKPLWFTEGEKGERLIWIVDTSATMSAMENQMSLLEQSKQQMKELASRLNGQEVTIINATAKPKIILNREDDVKTIQRTIAGLEPSYEHENLEKSVKLAESLVQKEETDIHIFTDSLKKSDLTTSREDVSYIIHNMKGIQDNLSLRSFGVSGMNKKISGLAVLENQGKSAKTFSFVVKSEDSRLFQQEISLPAGKQTVITIPDLPERRYYQAEISGADQYAADNEVTAVYTSMNPPIFAIGEVNPFLIKGFSILGIEVVQLDEAGAAAINDSGIILAEGIPAADLPKLPVIYIHKGANEDQAEDLQQALSSTNSPLLKYVDLNKTYIKAAVPPLPGKWETIVRSGSKHLIQTGMMNGQPAIVLNFSIEDTDWPLQPGFPIFLHNSYQWLSKQTGFLGIFQPGEEKWLQLGTDQANLEIYNAAEKNIGSFQLEKENFRAPVLPGLYQAVSNGQVYHFSVLLDDREKNPVLEDVPSFTIHSQTNKNEVTWKGQDSLWLWLAAVVLLVLIAEWEVYRRWQ